MNTITQGDFQDARDELLQKSKTKIETETAIKWGARALAAYSLFEEMGKASFLFDAIEYHHEAVEHASDTPILAEIRAVLEDEKTRVLQTF